MVRLFPAEPAQYERTYEYNLFVVSVREAIRRLLLTETPIDMPSVQYLGVYTD